MSIRIIKAGILDTIQDEGRHGYEHLGINPGGSMDLFSSRLSNVLLGKDPGAPVIEIHFPASQFLFEKSSVICITGADFSPTINGTSIPADHPVIVNKGAVLQFNHRNSGSRCYLSILQSMRIPSWLNSYSTHLKAAAGGFNGRALMKEDVIQFDEEIIIPAPLNNKLFYILPWKSMDVVDYRPEIQFMIGNEWFRLTPESQEIFQNSWFQVTVEADRMGYGLAGNKMTTISQEPLISSAVNFGTVQLLPNGQLIILMADHQTSGGYPRIAHVISAHLPLLAQKGPNDVIRFVMTDLQTSEEKIMKQHRYLQQLRQASRLRMEELGFIN